MEYLKILALKGKEVDEACERLAELRERAVSMSHSTSSMEFHSKSQNFSANEDRIIKAVEYEKKAYEMFFDYADMVFKALHIMMEMSDPIDITIITQKYISGRTLNEISMDMGLSYSYVKARHGKAVKKFEEALKSHSE